MHDIKKIMSNIREHGDEMTFDKLSCMFEDLIAHSSNPDKYVMDLHILQHGYHFDECMYNKAIEHMDPKWTVDTAVSVMSSHGIKFDGEWDEVTCYDKAFVMNMMYRSFYPLISDSSTASKFTEKYIKCPYPIKGGRAFAEWMIKCTLSKA